MPQDTPHVALLRGINVGGKNSLPMKSLAALATTAGAKNVQTHIQSGNVLFRATPAAAAKLCHTLEAAIAKTHTLKVPVQIRSLEQMEKIVANNPFAGEDPKLLYISFLSATPTKTQAAQLDPQRSPPDRFALVGDTLYLHLTNGAGKTKITNAWLDTKLGCISTWRNWGVTQTLLELLRAM